ncbi:MAG: arsenate reductase [Flavobacteriales bacterium]
MKKAYHLKTYTTCRRILVSFDLSDLVLRDIKNQPMTEVELQEMRQRSGSYESLFNLKSQKYRQLSLHAQPLGQAKYRRWILQEYTLLARSIFLVGNRIFIGGQAQVLNTLKDCLEILQNDKQRP